MQKFTKIISLLLVLCMVLSVAPAISSARVADAEADLWVDPVNGNDANDGTTEAKALKTIDVAKTKAAELSAEKDVVVILKSGTYDATETIVFGAAESGKNGHTITYRAASGETALISGGEQLDGWTLHDAAHNIYVTDIPEGAELTRQFYVDGEPQPMAAMELTPRDMSTFTSYGFESGSNTSADTSCWLRIDLGEGKLVSSVTLYGDDETSQTTGKAMGFPEDFIIETSPDGFTWTTQVTETNFSAPSALGGVEFNFSSTAAQYIRIKASKLGNPLKNSQTSALLYYMAFTEVQVGFTSKAYSVNPGIAQHVDLDSSVLPTRNISLTAGTPKEISVASSARAIAGFTVNVDDTYVGTMDNIKIQAYTNGAWKTVYTKNGFTWKQSNTFAINPVAATKIRFSSTQDMTITTLNVHKPAELNGSITAPGTGVSYLTDNAFGDSYNSGSQTSAIYKNDIVVDLGSVQGVGGVRLWPAYNGTEPAGYMTAARIQVSTDGVTYHTVLELPEIQIPAGGSQTLVLPRGYNAKYVKIQPTLLTGDGEYSLQLDELDIVPSKIEAINAEDEEPNYVSKKNYTQVSMSGVTPRLGYYTDTNGSFIDYEVVDGEAECIIDNERSYGYTKKFTYNELVQWGGSKVPSFLLELPAATKIGAIELAIDPDIWSAPLSFDIQVYTNGTWKTVATQTDPQWVDKLQPQPHYTERYEFDSVSITAARILVYNLTEEDGTYPESSISANPAGYTTDFCLNEFTLYQVNETFYEQQPDLDADTVNYGKVSLSNADILGFGHYYGSDLQDFRSYNDGSGAKIFDGDYSTYGSTNGQQYQWMPPYGPHMPALLLNAVKNGKPSTINAIELAVREDGLCAPYDFEIQVTTSADKDNWITVAKEESKDWSRSSKVIYKIPEMDVYKVRLVATLLTPASNIPEDQWAGATTTRLHINEFSLYNINDPTNPIAADMVTQGEGTTGAVIYDAKTAACNNPTTKYAPNQAIDGIIVPLENAGLSVSSDAKYNFSYLKHPEHMQMHTLYLWYHRIQHVSGASGDGTAIYLEDGLDTQSGEPLMPTWLANDYMFIDTPGEWYIDRYEGKIYYMADGTMDGKVAILPVTDKIIEMEDVKNVTFEGITFSHTSWTYPSTNKYSDQQANNYLENNTWVQVSAGIDLTSCVNVVFDGVQIRNMGTAGIRIKSDGDGISDGCKILNSLVCDISYNGIVIGETVAQAGYRNWQLVKNATVQNNFVTRIGLDMYDSVGIFAGYTNGVVIDHNEVSYTPYSGISLGWGWSQEEASKTDALDEVGNNKITYNYVHDVCKTNYDGGAIYTLGWQEDSEIAYNYIHNSGTTSTKTENAIYLDEGTAYMEVHHNVIGKVAQSWLQIWFRSIHDNYTHDNYYESGLSTRGTCVNLGNTTSGNTSYTSISSNSAVQNIVNNAGLTDESIKAGEDKGFARQHDIDQEYWGNTDHARYITDSQGWYNVRISGQVGRTYYDNVNKVATIVMPKGTDLSSLALQYSNESGWNVSPGTGTTRDFSNPVAYTITSAGGGTIKNWTVKVITQPDHTVAPKPPVDDDPGVPTIPPTTAPTTPPATEPGMQKINLIGRVVGTCSTNCASQSDYSKLSWYSDANPTWKDLSDFVDGDLDNAIVYGVSAGERADFYLDLTNGADGYTAIDQLKLYGGGSKQVPRVTIVLLLADGTKWERTYATNWEASSSSDLLDVIFDQTYHVKGVYVWEPDNATAGFGEIELYQFVGGGEEPTEPEQPTEPSVPTTPTEPEPPTITKQPKKAYTKAGSTAKFAVEATGTGLTYQWQSSTDGKTWKNCTSSKATSATFTFTSKSSHSSNYYRCVITDAAGNTVYTNAVRLYVLGVTTQPTTRKVAVGKTVKYTVAATGAGKVYQWQSSSDGKTWKNCVSSSATSATFTFTSKTSHSSNYYRCRITDSKGNVVYTDVVRLYVLGVTTQPKTQKVAVGETVKYTVKATGASKKYQWQYSTDGKTWTNCVSSSATTATFTFTSKTSHSSNYYRCKVTDSGGNVVYTDVVRLYVLGVTTQPTAKTVKAGETAKFTVKATGASKTYQWQYSADGGKTWTNCVSSSAKTATFTFTGKTSHNGNYYRCVVKDNAGNVVNSEKAKLTVK